MTLERTPSVAVIIPAYNAGRTLSATLTSVRAQTYRNLEIVVVDDGSTDDTLGVARLHAQQDGRIKVVVQQNAGVASARMRALRETGAGLIAPIDADDLWHETKIARQVDRLAECGPDTGLVYSWSAMIDEKGRRVGHNFQATAEGDVLKELCSGNFLSNASCVLMRRGILEAAGGYSSVLRDAGAQGCEDWLLYLRIARQWKFGLVPELLIGYRVVSYNMSGNTMTMWRSHTCVTSMLMAEWPDVAGRLERSHGTALRWLIQRSVVDRRPASALRLLREAVGSAPSQSAHFVSIAAASAAETAARQAWLSLPQSARARLKTWLGRPRRGGPGPEPGQPFVIGQVDGTLGEADCDDLVGAGEKPSGTEEVARIGACSAPAASDGAP